MANRRPSGTTELTVPVAPVVKRKRRASGLGEQERRERKRAIDREAQRSLREKTKTHIAELERTIQILRDQDRNGAAANLLSEIDSLRAENERLRDIIDSVKNALGNDIAPRTTAPTEQSTRNGAGAIASPSCSSNGHRSPKPQMIPFETDSKPSLLTPTELQNSYNLSEPTASTKKVDVDGMNIMTNVHASPALDLSLDLESVEETPTNTVTEIGRSQVDGQDWEDNAVTSSWGPLMQEFFGDGWRSLTPTVLHIGAPGSSNYPTPGTVCPIWKKSNELYEKIYTSCSTPGAGSLTLAKRKPSIAAEAGLLYLGIKEGWANTPDEWMQSPVLVILQQVDQILLHHLPRIERLASAYKSFKLLKYYLHGTAEQLSKVPKWLLPSITQTSTSYPITVDFFAWPTLRDRLVSQHSSIFQTSTFYHVYSRYLRFDWPFAFEDTFFYDDTKGYYCPSPLFESYHNDLRRWNVTEEFYEKFPDMRGDIEGDQRRFGESSGA